MRGFLAALALITLAAATPARAGSAATAEYARQVSTAQVRLAQLEALLVESELRIQQLEEVIRQQGKSNADRLENLDEVNAEVVRLRGAIEVLQFEVAELNRVQKDLQVGAERRQLHAEMRLAQVEKFLSLKPPPAPTDQDLGLAPGTTGSGTAPTPGSTGTGTGTPGTGGTASGGATPGTGAGGAAELPADVPNTAAGKLEAAAAHMAAGRQTVARAILKAAIDQHVGAPEMDEIRYRYAETFFNESDWRTAISEFNKVINNHPSSPWKCWSFYRQGEAFEKMGQAEGARAFYKGATDGACRTSDAAKEAKKKL